MTQQQARWRNRPPGSTWGDFGADDEIGRLNLIGPQQVLQGAAEIREGLTFCLSLPLDRPGGNVLNPRRLPPRLAPTRHAGVPRWMFETGTDTPGATDVINDDYAILYLQYSTQWDSFAHAGSLFDANGDGRPEPVFYNGFRGGVELPRASGEGDSLVSGAKHLGIERFAEHGVQGRGVLIDLRAHVGDARVAVGYEQLMRIIEADGVTIERGDMVLIHTGFAQHLLDWGGEPDPQRIHAICAVLDGRDERLLQWITDSGLAALIADNYAIEDAHAAKPAGSCALLPLHEHCLFRLGVPLGEIWYLTELAQWLRRAGRSRFMLTAPPLRLPGAVGSPATPIATV